MLGPYHGNRREVCRPWKVLRALEVVALKGTKSRVTTLLGEVRLAQQDEVRETDKQGQGSLYLPHSSSPVPDTTKPPRNVAAGPRPSTEFQSSGKPSSTLPSGKAQSQWAAPCSQQLTALLPPLRQEGKPPGSLTELPVTCPGSVLGGSLPVTEQLQSRNIALSTCLVRDLISSFPSRLPEWQAHSYHPGPSLQLVVVPACSTYLPLQGCPG